LAPFGIDFPDLLYPAAVKRTKGIRSKYSGLPFHGMLLARRNQNKDPKIWEAVRHRRRRESRVKGKPFPVPARRDVQAQRLLRDWRGPGSTRPEPAAAAEYVLRSRYLWRYLFVGVAAECAAEWMGSGNRAGQKCRNRFRVLQVIGVRELATREVVQRGSWEAADRRG
jgi:hypothetical protein